MNICSLAGALLPGAYDLTTTRVRMPNHNAAREHDAADVTLMRKCALAHGQSATFPDASALAHLPSYANVEESVAGRVTGPAENAPAEAARKSAARHNAPNEDIINNYLDVQCEARVCKHQKIVIILLF